MWDTNSITNTIKNTKTLGKSNEIEIYTGQKVFDLISDETFQGNWDALYDACPWATVFQSRDFVTTWYKMYSAMYLPIIVKNIERGKLSGLLTLTKNKNNLITGAGDAQAEYHVWLSTDVDSSSFIRKALKIIYKLFSGTKIQLKYIPANTPIKWLNDDSFLKRHCYLKSFKQPLLKLNIIHLTNELRKKNRREKINRLKKKGVLNFIHITDIAQFSSVLEYLVIQYDFRKLAMHNCAFFLYDSQRKNFLLSLFEQKLLHTTILKLNDEIIASNVSIVGKNWIHLQGINTHAPWFGKYSPGIIHFLMLGKQLTDEGIEIFDLTPGGDSYKEGLATDYALTYQLRIGSIFNHYADPILNNVIQKLKKVLSKMGLKPATIKKQSLMLLDNLKHTSLQKPAIVIKKIIRIIKGNGKISVLLAAGNGPIQFSYQISINKNSLQDLLQYEASEAGPTRWGFLSDAMRRLERGQSAYTYCQSGRLLATAWLEEGSRLHCFYIHPQGRTQLDEIVKAIIAKAIQDSGQVQVVTNSRDKQLCKALESAGCKNIG